MTKLNLPPPSCRENCDVDLAAEEFLANLEASGASQSTVKAHRYAIKDFIGHVGKKFANELTPQDFTSWRIKRLKEGFKYSKGSKESSSWTLYYYSLYVRSFLAWLGVLKEPLPSVSKPRRRRLHTTLTRDEVKKLVGASRDVIDVLIVSLLLETGLRAREALSLRKSDVDLDKREIRVLNAKFGESRIVFVGPLTYEVLSRYLPLLRDDDRVLQLSYTGLYKRLKSLATRAGVDVRKVRPHVFRHTFATDSIRRGITLPALQLLLGHKDIKTTQIYLHLAVEDIKNMYFKVFYSNQTSQESTA
ncbi:MAG: tyrosine-type recombinase/integrase [Sulfolobales archaeon]